MRKGSFLVMISVFIKFIGMIYRIPLTNMLGDAGNGSYGLAFQIYSFFIILSTIGVSSAISRMISERVARKEYANARQVFWVGMIYALTTGTLDFVILWFGADFISGTLFNDISAAAAVRCLAPATLMVSVSSVFRGMYQGLGEVRPTAYADLLDQVFHAVFSVLLVWVTLHTSGEIVMTAEGRYPVLEEAAAQAAMGSMYGTLGGLLFLLFIFLIFKARSSIFNAPASKITERKITIFKYFMWLVIPVMLSATVSNLRELIDTALFNFLMPLKGYSADYIGIQRGMMTGKYSVLTNMPISALGTLGIMLVPGVASAVTKKDYDGVKMQIDTLMKLVLMLTIPAAVGLSILGQPVVEWLFASSPEGGELLRYGSLIVIFYAVSQNAASILQGLDKTKLPVINAVKGTLVSIPVLVICILVLDLKVYAMVASVTVFSFSIAFFNMRSVLKYCQCKINMAHLIVSPTVCAVIMGVFTWAVYHGLYALYPSNTIAILASLGVSVIVYFLLILNSAWFTREQIADLPYGRYMLKLRFKK